MNPSDPTRPISIEPDHDAFEAMAREVHADFLRRLDVDGTDHPAAVPWEELTPQLKAQNRDQVRDNVAKLRSIGLIVVPAGTAGVLAPDALSDEVVEDLARREHDRWAQTKRAQGYRWGAERVDDPPDRQHPDLLPWESLDESTRDKDRDPVRQMLRVLDHAGFGVVAENDEAQRLVEGR